MLGKDPLIARCKRVGTHAVKEERVVGVGRIVGKEFRQAEGRFVARAYLVPYKFKLCVKRTLLWQER